MRILVTGATGFIGHTIVRQLLEAGHEPVVLTRNIPKAVLSLGSQCRYFQWRDMNELPPLEAFEGVDGVINLLGENISDQKWDFNQKKQIYNTRIDGTAHLIAAISQLEKRPATFVSASAVGVYGDRGDAELDENAAPASDFLAHVCKDWEREANRASEHGLRVVIIRVGVVIGRGGGALAKMLPVFKMGLGGKLGSGKQYMSWIHVEDIAAMFVEAITDVTLRGVYNGTAPYPATNAEFTEALGKVLKRPTFAPAPTFALKLALGEMSDVVLKGQKVLPVKFKEKNFRYRYPTLEKTLKETAY